MFSNNEYVLRLARTFPRVTQQGIGLHCYYFSTLSKAKSLIFTKYSSDEPISYDTEKICLEQIHYSDLSFERDKEPALRKALIILSKIYGDLVFFLRTLYLLISRHRKKRIKIIHLHTINYLITGLFFKVIFKVPLCINFGGTDLYRAKKIKFIRFLLRFVDKVFYVAHSMKGELLGMFPEQKLVHFGNGVDLDVFVPGGRNRKNLIFCVGNLRWQKGYEFLLRAFALLVKERSLDYHLKIAGDGPEKQMLINLSNELGICDRLEFLGGIDREAVANYMRNSKVFVMSSVTEGLPKAMLEAVACCTPVVVTDVGECKLVSEGVGESVAARDHIALAEKIYDVLSDDRLWDKYFSVCEQRRSCYGWQKVVEVIDGTYNLVIPN